MKNFWCSWNNDKDIDYELHWPWWISGYRCEDNVPTICAAVKAHNEDEAEQIIKAAYDEDPGGLDFRFIEEKPAGWSPFCDRFPRADWMNWDGEIDEL